MEVNFLDKEKEIKEYITKELDFYIDHGIYDEDKDYYIEIEEDAKYISDNNLIGILEKTHKLLN